MIPTPAQRDRLIDLLVAAVVTDIRKPTSTKIENPDVTGQVERRGLGAIERDEYRPIGD